MPYHVVDSISSSLNGQKKSLNGSRLLILGVAYKKDVDDLRESPALKIMQLLQQRGAQIDYNDPYFPQMHKMRHFNFENMKSVPIPKNRWPNTTRHHRYRSFQLRYQPSWTAQVSGRTPKCYAPRHPQPRIADLKTSPCKAGLYLLFAFCRQISSEMAV